MEHYLTPLISLLSFIDGHQGFFIAVFTAFVALFTWRLFRATAGLVNAERPQLLPEEIKVVGLSNVQDHDEFELRFSIKNYGRTPALLKRMRLDWQIAQKAPVKFKWKNALLHPIDYGWKFTLAQQKKFRQLHIIVPAGSAFSPVGKWPIFVPRDLQSKVTAGYTKFFILGTVIYTGVGGDRHSTNFAYEFVPAKEGRNEMFVPCGPRYFWRYR